MIGLPYSDTFLENATGEALREAAFDLKFRLEEILGQDRDRRLFEKTLLFCRDLTCALNIKNRASSPKASQLLVLLLNGVSGREQLHAGLYANYYCDEELPKVKIIDVYIVHLRDILQPIGIRIKTVWGFGFIIEAADRRDLIAMIERRAKTGELPTISDKRTKVKNTPLTHETRAAIISSWRDGLSANEISDKYNVPKGTVQRMLCTARQHDPSLYRRGPRGC